MNRTDELTDRLIDATLTDAEASELAALTATDPTALARHLSLLNLEAALRGLRTDLDLGDEVVRLIEAERARRTAANVLAEIADRPAPAWARPTPTRRRKVWLVAGCVAAALLAAVWLAFPSLDRSKATPEVARLRSVSGTVEVSGTDADGADRPVTAGQTVRTVGADSAAVLEFPDNTRLELSADTELRLASVGDGDSPRKLQLVHGQVSVVVNGRLTVLGGGAAEVSAWNGSFAAWASGPDSLRVESRDGDVQVTRGAPATAVTLGPGRAAFVRDEFTPTRLEPRFEVVATPRATLDFRGALGVAFAADGNEVWAASAKQRIRWRPVDGTTERLAFDPPSKNDGPVAALTADGRSLVACGIDDRDERTLIRDLTTGTIRHAVPVRASEPRFLCASPDASWVATFSPKPEHRLRVWETATGRERFARDLGEHPHCLAATPDGRSLAVDITNLRRDKDNRLDFLDAETGEVAFALPTARRAVMAVAFSAEGRRMAAGFNGAVQVWDVPDRRLLRTIEGFERVVTCLAFTADTGSIAAGTQDGQVWVWSADTGRRIAVLNTGNRWVRAVAFSPDGKSLVTATNKAPVALWEVTPEPPNDPDPGF